MDNQQPATIIAVSATWAELVRYIYSIAKAQGYVLVDGRANLALYTPLPVEDVAASEPADIGLGFPAGDLFPRYYQRYATVCVAPQADGGFRVHLTSALWTSEDDAFVTHLAAWNKAKIVGVQGDATDAPADPKLVVVRWVESQCEAKGDQGRLLVQLGMTRSTYSTWKQAYQPTDYAAPTPSDDELRLAIQLLENSATIQLPARLQ